MRTRRSLIDLDDLSADEIEAIFEETRAFEAHAPGRLLDGVDAVNLFFEQSTRTFTSFNLAQMRLGANVVNLSPKDLSLATKGETVEDTMLTLSAMGIGVIVIRHPEAGFPARMAAAFDGHVINAGDGSHAHPTQALLDLSYVEDVAAAVDMNLVMNGAGEFIELQGTGEESTYNDEQLAAMLAVGKTGIRQLLELQQAALAGG